MNELLFLGFFFNEYLSIIIFLGCALVFSFALFYLSYIFVGVLPMYHRIDMYAYECGFDPWQDTRTIFDVRFYLVGLLFLIFDVEILYLFPLATCIVSLNLIDFYYVIGFLGLLILGFFFESNLGILDW